MRKEIVLFLTAALLLVAGCASQQYVCPDGTTVDNVEDCPAEEQPGDSEEQDVNQPEQDSSAAPEEQPDEEDSNMEKIVKSALAKEMVKEVEDKVTSFSFVYVGPPKNMPQDKYYVKGNRILVELKQDTNFKETQPYSHVFLNTETKTAVAYCMAENDVWCPEAPTRHGPVEFDDYYVKTPYQWLLDLVSVEVTGGGPQWESSSTDRVLFETENASGEMLVLSFYGLPGKINLDNGNVIEFRDLSINSVTDAQVMPPE